MGGMWRSRSNFNEYMKDTWGSTLVSGGAGIVIPMKGFEVCALFLVEWMNVMVVCSHLTRVDLCVRVIWGETSGCV